MCEVCPSAECGVRVCGAFGLTDCSLQQHEAQHEKIGLLEMQNGAPIFLKEEWQNTVGFFNNC